MLTYRILTHAIGLVILGLIWQHARRQTGRLPAHQRAFRRLLGICAALLALSIAVCAASVNPLPLARALLLAVLALRHGLAPLAGIRWVQYVRSRIQEPEPPTRTLTAALYLPAILNGLVALSSIFWPLAFQADDSLAWPRGPLFPLLPLTLLTDIAIAAALAIRQRPQDLGSQRLQSMQHPQRQPLLLAGLLPAAGGAVQVLAGIELMGLSFALALLYVYLEVQTDQVFIDHLTGLPNRRRFDNYLDFLYSIGSFEPGASSLGGIMIDIDNFRQINDRYGHELGDRALESVGDILRRSVRQDDLVARIGGDEFALVLEVGSCGNLEETARRIRENVDRFNQSSHYPFALSLSIGYDLYDFRSGLIPKDFFKRIDDRMLEEKRINQASQPEHTGRDAAST